MVSNLRGMPEIKNSATHDIPSGGICTLTAKISAHSLRCNIVVPLPVSNDHRFLLTIVDRFSRWFEALPLWDITAKSCADAFILHFVARYDALHTITVDRGTQFTSTLWKELTKFFGCELIHTTAYNSKANGLIERYHRVLEVL